MTFNPKTLYLDGLELTGGGLFGGLLGTLLWNCFRIAAPIIAIAGLLILVPVIFGLTPKGVYLIISSKIKESREHRKEVSDEQEILRRDRIERQKQIREQKAAEKRIPVTSSNQSSQLTFDDEPASIPSKKKQPREDFVADVPMPDGDKYEDIAPEIDESIFDSVLREQEEASEELSDGRLSDKIDGFSPEPEAEEAEESTEYAEAVAEICSDDFTKEENVDLKKIFTDPDDAELLDKLCAAYMPEESGADTEIAVKRDAVSSVEDTIEEEPIPENPPYKFPPLELLSPDNSGKDTGVRDELKENARKLVETLQSFNVKTRIVDVCRGPTITRYELMPESGTKVRTIANLTDDIALAFAVKGVRIEAPVPGKSAVGIEVPNKTAATVHLRTLLDDSRFTDAQSKLNTALGEDVAGEAVYLDVAKMPHLLIAGATGMGKSVCINCLIVSLLYKANPDEVKLILIDPKKVEFSLYSGLPHLLVPVVTDPKKAAGSLSWAVSEMERRFNILENARVRDITKYNQMAKLEEGMEILPQIVIIIDELADLMMTASDDVEKSIARLAQKARAAGMHLIIGTQRPSVDVITGLIKNNIPSRISCAVTSQVDSRTILDRAGAEKLIGRGDMLYKPVGIDPIRVQGAFVSESEVEAVVEFIKTQNTGKTESYSEEVIEQIEREAELCGVSGKKKAALDGAAADDGDDDPMLRAAVELAVESKKISTSLIQRKLSLGYGRAAKLIDRMEQLGYVSAPDGQKPREVLITKQEFMEMSMKDE
ncbi:MAG: DNA translocase FtsK [Ruminococcaceae bacterium]|nr:DNA translocase FtsK [Oscillospiraceae bacterium]